MWKVVTWNLNSIKARQDRLLAFLKRENPDVVLLQELKCEQFKFPFDSLQAIGFHCAVFGQKAYNGVAILSKTPLTDVFLGFGGDGQGDEARLIAATTRGIRVSSVYVPNGQSVGSEKYAYKLSWLERLRQHWDRTLQPASACIVGGDFNIAPEDRDVHDPQLWTGKILFSEPEKDSLSRLCAHRLGDTFRKHESDGGFYSWWDYRMLAFPKNHGLRIDFLFATPSLYESCVSARIDRNERKGALASDHAPVLAEFDLSQLR